MLFVYDKIILPQVLLSFVRADMEDSQKQVECSWFWGIQRKQKTDCCCQGAAFNMLKAILSCKMMTSDVYDVMKRVMELLVTCQMDRSPPKPLTLIM